MNLQNMKQKLNRLYKQVNGSTIQYDLHEYNETLLLIKEQLRFLHNKNLHDLQYEFSKLSQGNHESDCLDKNLISCFAIVYKCIELVLKISPFDEQVIAGIALHKGKLVEMQTGEGKTLAALFPACLNAISKKGVHILTFNDYLAKRDSLWMKPVYEALGLSVGCVQEISTLKERQEAYNCDITYCTARESGFDFLRDSLCYSVEHLSHGALHYAIIDEADSLLIDEARIPLVIAGRMNTFEEKNEAEKPTPIPEIIKQLIQHEHFDYDTYARNIILTEKGIQKVESMLECENIYNEDNSFLLSKVYYALHAQFLLTKDKDYIIRNNKIGLIDEFTGRVAEHRQWPFLLQRAVEEKEGIQSSCRGKILNSISLQNFLLQYSKLGAMTATACQAHEEFREFYNLHIIVIPTHNKCIRRDNPDIIYKTKMEKYDAIIQEIQRIHQTGQPILVGTQTITESEIIATKLQALHLKCTVLNAKDNTYEAQIIKEAGKYKAITISTNMAGRGTDICLGGSDKSDYERIASLGGLHVLGTTRYESRRIDNQLRGRSGRQGDRGESQFIISLEDDLFIKYRLHELIPKNCDDNKEQIIHNQTVYNEIERIQRIIEGQHFEIKKTLCKYTFLIEKQRRIINKKRKTFLLLSNEYQFNELTKYIDRTIPEIPKELFQICKDTTLFIIDKYWADYLEFVNDLRDTIHLRKIGGLDPLFEFQKTVIPAFENILSEIDIEIAKNCISILNNKGEGHSKVHDINGPQGTWTYLINDNPFEDDFILKNFTNTGFSAIAGIMFPLTLLLLIVKKFTNTNKKKSLE